MAKPVMNHELDPGCSQQVDNSGGFELRAFHQFFTDDSRIGSHKICIGRMSCKFPWHIAAKSHARASHEGLLKVIEFAVRIPNTIKTSILHWTGCKTSLVIS